MFINFRKTLKMPLFAAFFFLLSAVIISGCNKSGMRVDYDKPGKPAYGDTIVSGSIGDAKTLIPFIASDSASHQICGLVYNGLVKYDKDMNLTGDLAETWEVKENGLVIVFHLRKDVKWHDGTDFTSKDVLFTYEKIMDPNVRTPYRGDFERIKQLKVIDDYTIEVTYKEPFSPALSSWGMNIIPYHLLKDEDLNTTEFARKPIGTGPYKFKKWVTGSYIELGAFDNYFEGRPYISKYVYRIIPDQTGLFLELLTGGVDEAGITPLQYVRQTDLAGFKRQYQKFQYPSFGYAYLGFNLNLEKFKDKRVRKAINYAINKQEIIDSLLLGKGEIVTGPFAPTSWAYNHSVKPDTYDPEKARQLLSEAGWSDADNDGILEKDSEQFEFTIITNQGNENRKMSAEIIQRRLAEVGIKVKIRVVEWSTFITEFIDKRQFEAVILAWSLSLDPDIYDIWYSSKTKQGEFNFLGYKNSEVDRLLIQGRRIFDQKQRQKIYYKIHELIYNDQPCIFLYIQDSLVALHKRFKNVEVSKIGIGYNFIKWYVPKKQQKYQ